MERTFVRLSRARVLVHDYERHFASRPRGQLLTHPLGVGWRRVLWLWFRQYSPYYVEADSYGLQFWNPAGVNARGGSAPGVTVTWYDSAKKRWVPSDLRLDHNSNQIWDVPGRGVMVRSGVWNHQLARITFASSAKPGLWHFEGEAPQSWSVVTKFGGGTSAELQLSQRPLQQIRVTK